MFKTLEKLRRAPHRVRENFTAFITIVVVGCVTLVWFLFFVFSLLSKDFHTLIPAAQNNTSEAPKVDLKGPFAE